MPRTYVQNFYANTAEELTNDINAHARLMTAEIQSLQVFKSPKNEWFEAIVVFENPIVVSMLEPDIIDGPGITCSQTG
ncbi:hypothetical protein [Acinetobacter schindleri]|uniref:hypothetical protein n=1 Tax=Acinetobacter schindleri TaxID=108981 RepID=UPI0013B09C05|nr:hypothetical protein [Acinetobacter schindleri]QIC63306.1 hypothetical protein FSC11_02560 [Acinetobacter schindleri]